MLFLHVGNDFPPPCYLDDSFSFFTSWLRCHLLTEAIPDHLGGFKMSVKSVTTFPLGGGVYFPVLELGLAPGLP